MDPASPAPSILGTLLAALPAVLVAIFGAASFAAASLSGPRKAALLENLDEASRAPLRRYIELGPMIESRWLVLRVLGISTSSALFAGQLGPRLGGWQPLVAALVALLAYGIPAEILKGIAARAPERAAVLLLRYLKPIEILAAPIASPLSRLGGLIGRKVVTAAHTLPPPNVTETEVGILVDEGEAAGALDHDQSEMIRNVLDFRALTAGEAMIPRTRVTAFDVETSTAELMRLIAESGHSRYPVYRERIDNVIGLLHAKDLLAWAAKNPDLTGLSFEAMLRRPVAFVPATQHASAVLKDMRAGRHHLAIVIDEFGGMAGIVTLEDLVEEIVGDIQDEHDVEELSIVDLEDGRFVANASVSIAELNRHLGESFPEDADYNSLGGLLLDRLGRVPEVGTKVTVRGFVFHVLEADERHVGKVEIERAPSEATPKASSVSAA